MPTIKKQVVVPLNEVPSDLMKEALKATEHRWRPFTDEQGRIMGFHAPKYGAIVRSAYVMADVDEETGDIVKITKFQFDQMIRKDGPIDDPYGHATPNAMAIVVERREDGYWIHGTKEYRPVIYNHLEDKQGVSVDGITGGWAKEVGSSPAETALDELAAEAGFEIDEASIERINIHSPNRAYEEACNEIYLAVFRRKGERKPDESHEVIEGEVVFRLDNFPLGPDALVNSALWAVAKHLGCISPIPGELPEDKELADLHMQIEKLEVELAVKPSLKRWIRNQLKRLVEWFE